MCKIWGHRGTKGTQISKRPENSLKTVTVIDVTINVGTWQLALLDNYWQSLEPPSTWTYYIPIYNSQFLQKISLSSFVIFYYYAVFIIIVLKRKN